MASIFDKFHTLVMGNLHDLLDKAIDLNSPAAIKQYIRDLENAKNDLENEAAVAAGNVVTLTREIGTITGNMDVQGKNIDLILNDGNQDNDHIAQAMELELMNMETGLDAKKEELEAAKTTAKSLSEVSKKLSAKHAKMVNALSRLESQARAASAKERAAAAITTHSSTLGSAPSVDNLARRMQARDDVADAKLKGAMGSMTESGEDEVARLKAQERLEARKAKLNAGSAGAGS